MLGVRVEEMLTAVVSEICKARVEIRQRSAKQEALDISRAQLVLGVGPYGLGAHGDQAHERGVLCPDIAGNGCGVEQAAGQNLLCALRCGSDALGPGAGGVDDAPPAHCGLRDGRGRVAKVKALALCPVALAHQDRLRVLCAEGEGLLERGHGPDLARTAAGKVALERKGTEHVDHHGKPPRLTRAGQTMQNLNFHLNVAPFYFCLL